MANPIRRILLAALAALAAFSASALAEEKKIALTFDDLPALGPFGYWEPREISNMILRALQEHGITAAAFVVAERIDEDPATYVVLLDWFEQGHTVGNQTYGDVDLNQITVDDFLEHVADGQKHLRRAARATDSNYRYLRFPFLHQGETERKKNRIAKTLYNAGYETAHVTVKTSDYRFNRAFLDHQADAPTRERLKSIYMEHLTLSLEYSERQSEAVFGRQIPHILWLHSTPVTALFLPDVIRLLEDRDYGFIPLPEALADRAYQSEESYVGPLGLTFIDRVAATRGLPFDPGQGELSRAEIARRLRGP